MNELRIRSLVLFLALALAGLVAGLSGIAVFDHDLWRARAYDNAWSFDSVPARRATIFGRDGVALAKDVPSYDVQLTYREFRRRHPVASVIHGANLARTAFGQTAWDAPAAYGFDHPVSAERAFEVMSRLDLSWLNEAKVNEQLLRRVPRYRPAGSVSQDLRFYLASMLSGLTDWSWNRWSLAISKRREVRGPIYVSLRRELSEAFGLSRASADRCLEELRGRFHAQVEEFHELASLLDELHAAERDRAGRPPLDRPWSFLRVLEEARLSSENQADARALSEQAQRNVEIGDFWRLLAKRGHWVSTVRDWLLVDERERLKFESEFPEERKAAERVLSAKIENAGASVDDVDLHAWRVAKHLGRYVGTEGIEEFEPPRLRDEYQSRTIVRRVLFDHAVQLKTTYARHPGLRVTPSVERRVELELEGLEPYLGKVSLLSFEDRIASEYGEDSAASRARREGIDVFQIGAASNAVGEENDTADDLFFGGLNAHLRAQEMQALRIGRSGVERSMDERLRGSDGVRFVDTNRAGEELAMHEMSPVEGGQSVTLTIEPRMQAFADAITQRLGEASQRALVALDPQTGDILALSGHGLRFVLEDGDRDLDEGALWAIPDYDIDGSQFDLAATWPRTDPSIGSVIKPLMALEYLTALADGRYEVPCSQFGACGASDSFYRRIKGSHRFGCSHHHGAASQDVVEALARSCNIFFYEIWRHASALDLEGNRLKGVVPGPAIGDLVADRMNWQLGRAPGSIPGLDDRLHVTPHEIEAYLDEDENIRRGRESMVRTIGYDWRVSALDVAHAYAMVATGRRVPLGLVQERERRASPVGWASSHLDLVREGLRGCLEYGTAKAWRGRVANMGLLEDAYAKTGTAFIKKRKIEETGIERDYHNSWFAFCLGERGDARLVIVAAAYLVEQYGSAEAGSMVMRLLEQINQDDELRQRYLERGK